MKQASPYRAGRVAIPRAEEHQWARHRHRGRRHGRPARRIYAPTRRAASGRPTTTANVDADFRRHAVHEHRRPRRRAIEPGHPLGRHRRSEHLPRLDGRRRHLQVHRRRADLHAHGARPIRRRSAASSSTPPTPTSSTSPRRATSGPTTRCAASSRPPTAAQTWNKVLYKSPRTGAWDLVMDPANPDVIYASMWQRVRRKWSDPRVEPGYSEGGVFKTTDGGKTWTEIEHGPARRRAPRTHRHRHLAFAIPKVLYAFVDNYEPGVPAKEGERDAYGRPIFEARIKAAEVYRTDDGGTSWRKVSDSNQFMTNHSGTYGWVFGQIRVDPTNENTIYTLGLQSQRLDRRRQDLCDLRQLAVDPQRPSRPVDRSEEHAGRSTAPTTAASTRPRTRARPGSSPSSAGGAQFYNITVDRARRRGSMGRSRTSAACRGRFDLSAGRDKIALVDFEERPWRRGLASRRSTRRTRTSSTRTASTGTSRG